MIDEPLEAPRPFPWAAAWFGLAAIGLLIMAAIWHTVHLAALAVPCAAVGIFLFLVVPRGMTGRLTATALEVDDPPQVIPYADIEGLWAQGKNRHPDRMAGRSFAIDIAHRHGVLRIPRLRHPPAEDVYRLLYAALTPGGAPPAHQPDLEEHRLEQENTFGPERVWSYSARQHLARRLVFHTQLAVLGALLVTGIAWTVIGFQGKDLIAWSVFGIILIIFSILLGPLFWFDTRRAPGNIRNWRSAGLVISPIGLAMIQGDVRGEMRWDEVQKIRLNSSAPISTRSPGPGIILDAEAVQIVIADIYDRPLPRIMEQIRRYWRKND